MARKPSHKIKSPAPRNRAALNPSGKPTTKPVATPVSSPGTTAPGVPAPSLPSRTSMGTPDLSGDGGTQYTNYARFSDEGAAIAQLQTTPQPDLGYDDTPLADADGIQHYVYVSDAPLMAVGNRLA